MLTKELKIEVPDEIAGLVPYPPGKPIEELERELGISGSIKLASNENPLGPSKKALEALYRNLKNIHRYPDGSCYYLKQGLSKHLGVPEDMLIVGNGSNEIIELLLRTFLKPGDEVVMAEPSFAVYPLAVQAMGGVSRRVPLDADMRHDLKEMAGAVNSKTKIVFIANPNNPTGTIVTEEELRGFIESLPRNVIICVDEAYYEYVRSPDFPHTLGYIKGGRAVLLLRTFSKIYGLAGLRVGYGVGPAELVNYMNRVRQPFNVNMLAQTAALAALDDRAHVQRSRENNFKGIEYLFLEIKKLGLECVPTEANFFLIRVGDGGAVYRALLKKGVIVRPMKSYGLDEYIRVTVGLPEENKRFLDALSEVVKG